MIWGFTLIGIAVLSGIQLLAKLMEDDALTASVIVCLYTVVVFLGSAIYIAEALE